MKHVMQTGFAAALALAALTTAGSVAKADEGGVSFWIPGLYGSLAASPLQPGWTTSFTYYQTNVSASGDVALAREFQIGRIPVNLRVDANLNLNLNAYGDLGFITALYTFKEPVLGGQLSVGALSPIYGTTGTTINGTLTGALTVPGFGVFPFARSDSITGTAWGFGDIIPVATLRWNSGVNNFMTYITGDIPVGVYSASSIANIGIGHGVIDVGGGYTYLNPQTGNEFSAVLGFSYNFINQSTQYQNGVDMHLDWGTSHFFTKQVLAGLVGYVYKEVGCDSGSGDHVGCFQSQVVGIGPQAGYIFPIGKELQGYVNVKGYREFGNKDRPDGWNTWLTLTISPAAEPTPSAKPRMVTK
jgi:hypothetical protein